MRQAKKLFFQISITGITFLSPDCVQSHRHFVACAAVECHLYLCQSIRGVFGPWCRDHIQFGRWGIICTGYPLDWSSWILSVFITNCAHPLSCRALKFRPLDGISFLVSEIVTGTYTSSGVRPLWMMSTEWTCIDIFAGFYHFCPVKEKLMKVLSF